MPDVTTPRLSAEQVLALAPTAASRRLARSIATPSSWRETGHGGEPPVAWGLCVGTAAEPYRVCVDAADLAFTCSCPSPLNPCKHALALLLLWSAGDVPAAAPPEWAVEWQAGRRERRAKAAAKARAGRTSAGGPAASAAGTDRPPAPTKASQRRAARVAAGVLELDRWLADQVRQGIASAARAGYAHWDAMAARLVDAQAPGLAGAVRRLASVAAVPDRLLTELSLIRLLVAAYQHIDTLPIDTAATVRSRIGFPVSSDEVLAQLPVRDRWSVIAVRDEEQERLTVRRCWLRGADTGRPALVLTFAPTGQPLAAELIPGTAVDADLCFFPGALPLRALVANRHRPPEPLAGLSGGRSIRDALDEHARALAAEPWLTRWPMLLSGVVPVADHAGRWHLRDSAGDAVPLDPAIGPPWRLVAAVGGVNTTVAGEWTPTGLRPLTAWADGRLVST